MDTKPPGNLLPGVHALGEQPSHLDLTVQGTELTQAVGVPASACMPLHLVLTGETFFVSSPPSRAHFFSTQSCMLLWGGHRKVMQECRGHSLTLSEESVACRAAIAVILAWILARVPSQTRRVPCAVHQRSSVVLSAWAYASSVLAQHAYAVQSRRVHGLRSGAALRRQIPRATWGDREPRPAVPTE
jgi:hypothetical protein